MLRFVSKFLAKIVANAVGLYAAAYFLTGVSLSGGWQGLLMAAVILAVLHTILRPILKIVTAPLVLITFGLFTVIINIAILWIADKYLTQIAFADLYSLAVSAVIITVANIFI
ncbi:MAG: phage holin family protein [bacterium]|nr:phage holin family protein [bacterium]MDZ4260701.1 phage holin family protein [Candidatus Sungbacteria bacterium]